MKLFQQLMIMNLTPRSRLHATVCTWSFRSLHKRISPPFSPAIPPKTVLLCPPVVTLLQLFHCTPQAIVFFSQLCTRSETPLTSQRTTSRLPLSETGERRRLCDGRRRETWNPRVPPSCVCVAKLLSNLSLSVYTSKECCQILTDISLSHAASWENATFKEEKKGLFWKIQRWFPS